MNPILLENLKNFDIVVSRNEGIVQYYKLQLKPGAVTSFAEASGLENGIRHLVITGNYVDYVSPPLAELIQTHILKITQAKKNFGRK